MAVPVLFLIQHLDQGGTEHHLYDLICGLDRTRFAPHVIYSTPGIVSGKLAALTQRDGASVALREMHVTRAYDASAFKAIWQLRRYLRRHRIGLVVTFHFVADMLGTLAAAAGGPPVISSRRDMGFTRTARQKWLGGKLDCGVTRYIAVSDAVRQAIVRDEQLPPRKVEVIHNGIDAAKLDAQAWNLVEERARQGIAPDEIVIGCVANFNPVKGHVTLAEAFGLLCQARPELPLRLLLAGEGEMRPQIEAMLDRYGVRNRAVMDGLSPAVAREFQMADLVVLPSDTEGFSNSIVQAMYYRKPVVACDVGGNPEAIVQGETGLLVPPRNPQAMAEALGRLAGDAALRATMGSAGHARAQREFTLCAMLTKTHQLFDQVIGE
jgi:glycosyltransferase involved in cell wall biosynthesis